PEFLNRLDEILLFQRLQRDQIKGIVDIQLRYLERLLADRRMSLELDDKAKALLAERGYDPVYGARPLKRVIQSELQNPLAEKILKGEILDGAKIEVGVNKDALSFKIQNPKAGKDDLKSVA